MEQDHSHVERQRSRPSRRMSVVILSGQGRRWEGGGGEEGRRRGGGGGRGRGGTHPYLIGGGVLPKRPSS